MSTPETEHAHDIARGEDVIRGVYVETCMVYGCPYLQERPSLTFVPAPPGGIRIAGKRNDDGTWDVRRVSDG